jgi:hypothetical protein
MSSKLNLLESKKLLKEFKYLVSDVEFKNEFATEYSRPFEIAIKQFIKENPHIKELCKDKFGSLLDPDPKKPTESDSVGSDSESIEPNSETDIAIFTGELMEEDETPVLEFDENKVKKLYREIVQKTHPDKVKSDALNNLYNKATSANKRKDLMAMYSICDELGINFNVSQKEIDTLKERINTIKIQQIFFEKSHLWAWCENDYNEPKRKEIIQHLILNNAPSIKDLLS